MRVYVVLLACLVAAGAQAEEGKKAGWLEAARLMRPQAQLAISEQDWEAAWRLNAAGRALQPGHTGLIRQAVRIADRAGDADRLLEALNALARAGSSLDMDDLKSAEHLPADAPASLRARFKSNEAPVGHASVAAEVALPDALIESVTVDPRTGALYLGSVMDRRIYRVDPDLPGRVEIFADRSDGLYSVFGMAVDAAGRRLYATTGTVAQTPLDEGEKRGTGLLVFDLKTGSVLGRHGVEGAKQMADLFVIDGAVYVTDAQAPRIYRLAADGRKLEVFAEDPRFVSLQGIAPLNDDLIVADYAVGLWRVDRRTGRATMVRPPDGGPSLIGIDGLTAAPGRTLYAVRNGVPPHSVLRLTYSAGGGLTRVETEMRGHEAFDEPTLMAVSRGRAFLVARSQWPLFPADGTTPARRRANPVILTWPPVRDD